MQFGVVHGDDGAFEFAVEGDLGVDASLLFHHVLVNGDLGVLQPLDQADLGAVADRLVEAVLGHLDVCLRVEDDRLDDLFDDLVVKFTVQ